MPDNFDNVWRHIQTSLKEGEAIRNWSAYRGYTEGRFIVDHHMQPTAITVRSDGKSQPRRISKGDFKKVWEVWEQYSSGNYPRSKLIFLSQNTTYIISILNKLGTTKV